MDTREAVLRFLPDRVNQRNDLIVTPPRIAEDMINILPDDVWNSSTKFLDPMCKDGIFLYKIYVKLMASESLIAKFPDEMERKDHILHHQLYGVSPERLCQLMTIRTVYGTLNTENNIKLAKSTNISDIRSVIEKEFNGMQFDVVVGNPPYNRGMDLDFVDLGYKISSKYVCMITPAKWQTTADDYSGCASKNINYKQFREKYVPHMSYVCYYPACKDVFGILQVDGITWTLIDKHEHEKCTVENRCRYTKEFNGIEIRSIRNRESLFNIGNEIVKYLGKYNTFSFPYQYQYKRFQVWTNTQVPGGGLSTQVTVRKTQFVGESHIEVDNGMNAKHSVASVCSFSSDDRTECESFISWLNTKFTRFFVAINPTKLTGIITDDDFRFVPAPPSGKFDHIYTDEELYKAFNLPQKYIDVIEAVVKERK